MSDNFVRVTDGDFPNSAKEALQEIEAINAGILKMAGISAFEMGCHAFNQHLGKQENPFFPSSAAAESWDQGWDATEETQSEEMSFLEEEEAGEEREDDDESLESFGYDGEGGD